jgi:hypothetical protein
MLTRTLMPRPRPGTSRPRPRPGPSRPRPRPRPSRPRPRTRPSKPRPRTNKLSLLIPFLSYNTLTHKMIQYNTRFPARKANLCNILLQKHAMQLQQSGANRNHVQCISTTEAFNVRLYQAVSSQKQPPTKQHICLNYNISSVNLSCYCILRTLVFREVHQTCVPGVV